MSDSRSARKGLTPLSHADYLTFEPDAQEAIGHRMDLYFNTPLEIFPFSEGGGKPKRFFAFYEESNRERFPDEEEMRGFISRYTRGFFGSLVFYVVVKRLLLAAALAGISLLVMKGPALLAQGQAVSAMHVGASLAGILLIYPIYAGVNALVFSQYRISLENRSYELSRLIIQRTQELQRLFTTVKAMPDQMETQFTNNGKGWGERSKYLVRLLIWLGARVEAVEKFLQVEMWRVRRERYWTNRAGFLLVALILFGWVAYLALQAAPAVNPLAFRVLQIFGLMVGGALGLSSYVFWQTPFNLAKDTLATDSWVRFGDLDVDDVVGEQVNRDKNRLVEYRTLNKNG